MASSWLAHWPPLGKCSPRKYFFVFPWSLEAQSWWYPQAATDLPLKDQSRQEACMRDKPCVLQGHLHTQANHCRLLVLSPDFPADPSEGLRTAGEMGNLNRSQWLGQGSELVSPAQELLASFQVPIYHSTSFRPAQGQQRHWPHGHLGHVLRHMLHGRRSAG